MVAVRKKEAQNWTATKEVESKASDLKLEESRVTQARELVKIREQEVKRQEDQRRRNRMTSAAFIEDDFARLSARSVVEHLTHSSAKVRQHAMDNISSCISGFRDAPSTFVRFAPQDIAHDLLPKLHQLVSSSVEPLDFEVRFCKDVASAPPVARALALNGQCNLLSDYLVERTEYANRLAILSFRQMVGMETSVVKPAYNALALAIPHIPVLGSSKSYAAVDFVQEVSPKIIDDCFNNNLWSSITPLVIHRIDSIRRTALHKIVSEAQQSDRIRNGLAEANTLRLLDVQYQLPSPPSDIVDFFTELLPLVAENLCRSSEHVSWLLIRLGDANAKISAAIIKAFSVCAAKQDPIILRTFVATQVLRWLDEPPTQQSPKITQLITELLPALAISYARAKTGAGIVSFLDHADNQISTAAMVGCRKIMDSTADDRAHLYSLISNLGFTKESTLKLCDYTMPIFCKDWAASGDYASIAKFIHHSQRRMRSPAHKAWRDVIIHSAPARAKIVRDGLLNVIFELCHSQYDDVVYLGSQCCAPMAIEITQAGSAPVRQLVELLNHPKDILRQAALQGIRIASESSDANCSMILGADAFSALKLFLETYLTDHLDNAQKILTRWAPFLSTSPETCAGLLQLLESNSPMVQSAAQTALANIAHTNTQYRETLRDTILSRTLIASETLIEFSVVAIKRWIGPDLVELNDFATLFSLASHTDHRVQNAALDSVIQRIRNPLHEESMEKANVVNLIRALSTSDNVSAVTFVAVALTSLGPSLARNGHMSLILQLLSSSEPKLRDAAAAALEVIASCSTQERKHLVDGDIVERLMGSQTLDQTLLVLLSSIIPKLALDYLDAGKVDFILTWVDHHQKQIRLAATSAVNIIAGGTPEQRTCLRDSLLPRLGEASDVLREVAAKCLSRNLAHDLLMGGDMIQVFWTIDHADIRVRGPVVEQLRAYIQGCDEAARRRLVDAGILQAILRVSIPARDDLVKFMASCVLPMLGPALSHNDGGATVFSLLSNADARIRTAAVQALRNGVDHRQGDMEKMTKACIIQNLYPITRTDSAVLDLWCHVLPKAAVFLSNRGEIDILFNSLTDNREIVRKAASAAVIAMARTSETTRGDLFPSLLSRLENTASSVLPLIAQVVSRSGSAFLSNDKQAELVHLILHDEEKMVAASVEAITQLLSKGSSYEHRKLLEADVFLVALEFHDGGSHRRLSLKLLHSIVTHLSYDLICDDELARCLFSLFDDPDVGLSQALQHTWTTDHKVYNSPSFRQFLPILFEGQKLRNPSVIGLLCSLAPLLVPLLVADQQIGTIVDALKVSQTNIVRAFLQEVSTAIRNATEDEKDLFISNSSFIHLVSDRVKSPDITMRRDACSIVEMLSKGSQRRSRRIMEKGIGCSLAAVALNGEKGAQQPSLLALYDLFVAAPEYGDHLVKDCLPALCKILEDLNRPLDVSRSALHLLNEITRQSPNSMTKVECDIVVCLVQWLSPQHSVTDSECKQCVIDICQMIAKYSDDGRKTLIGAGILPVLTRLTKSCTASYVVGGCDIVNALAHTGVYRQDIISSGLYDVMKGFTSIFRKSSFRSKADKKDTQDAAKAVLSTLKSTENITTGTGTPIQVSARQSSLRHSLSTSHFVSPRARIASPVVETSPNLINTGGTQAPRMQHARFLTESSIHHAYDDMHDVIYAGSNGQPIPPNLERAATGVSSMGRRAALQQIRRTNLSQVREDGNDFEQSLHPPTSYPETAEDSAREPRYDAPSGPRSNNRALSNSETGTTAPTYATLDPNIQLESQYPPTSRPTGEDSSVLEHDLSGSRITNGSLHSSQRQSTLPSYRTQLSSQGSLSRRL